VNQKKSPARKLLEVTIMFEPTRLATEHLADAYIQVVPLHLRSSNSSQKALDAHAEPSAPIIREERL
jgi:hypothetical protein